VLGIGWKNFAETGLCIAVGIGLYLISRYNYLLFHGLVEMFCIAVAWGIFFVAWNARHVMENGYLLFMGIACLFIGMMDLLHVLAYKGMQVFPGYDANLPTQLWIAWQYMFCLSYTVAFLFFRRKFNPAILTAIYAVITALMILMIFSKIFPDCYIEGKGLTLFKKLSEIITSIILIAMIPLLLFRQDYFPKRILKLLSASILGAVGAKTAFIFYVSVYGLSNLIGHYLMVFSFFMMYKAIVETGISNPSEILFRELRQRETELKNIELELRKAKNELEERVVKRTRELLKANIQLELEISERQHVEKELRESEERFKQRNLQLEQINRQLDDFAYIISHDLREPLRGMYNFSAILIEDYKDKLGAEGSSMLETLMRLAKRQEEQIRAILHYSRIGRMNLSVERISLDAIVHEVIDSLKTLLDENRISVHKPVKLPDAVCDRVQLVEVFQNLIVNAVQYNDKQDRRIEIGFGGTEAAPVSVPDIPETCGESVFLKSACVFYVRDNGIGIEERHLESIFKIFTRLHGREDFGGGAGVGLTIAKKIIERHGGKIWAESVPGQGTTFYFTLRCYTGSGVLK